MTTDTPRTDSCGFCGEHDCKPYYRPHGQECRSPLCEVTERAKKAEAEVERLRKLIEQLFDATEPACDETCKCSWRLLEREYSQLAALKSEIK
jgi:hypothetical protein